MIDEVNHTEPCHKKSQELTPKQRRALYLLAEGATLSGVAKTLKVRRETVSRWKNLPLFRQEYDDVMNTTRQHLQHRMTTLADHTLQAIIMALHKGYYREQDLYRLLERAYPSDQRNERQ